MGKRFSKIWNFTPSKPLNNAFHANFNTLIEQLDNLQESNQRQ